MIEAGLPPRFDGLDAAARQVGGVQIQNAGTLVGNVCNASPAADGIPCLLALDAEVELASVRRPRAVSVGRVRARPAAHGARGPTNWYSACACPAGPAEGALVLREARRARAIS